MAKFKLYDDKNSLLKRYSRHRQGGTTDLFEKRLGWWEKRTDIPKDQIDDITFMIESQHEFRPDIVSFLVYGRADLEWLVLQYNNIVDINEEFKAGRELKLPSANRALYEIAVQPFSRREVENVNT